MTMNNTQPDAAAPVKGQPAKAIDFEKVEALRKHMLLTADSMAKLLGCSRVTYYSWLKDAKPRYPEKVRNTVRKLVAVVTKHNWPYDAVFQSLQPQRLEMLQELITSLDKPADPQ